MSEQQIAMLEQLTTELTALTKSLGDKDKINFVAGMLNVICAGLNCEDKVVRDQLILAVGPVMINIVLDGALLKQD